MNDSGKAMLKTRPEYARMELVDAIGGLQDDFTKNRKAVELAMQQRLAEQKKTGSKLTYSDDLPTWKSYNAKLFTYRLKELEFYRNRTKESGSAKVKGDLFLKEYIRRVSKQPDALDHNTVERLSQQAAESGNKDLLVRAYHSRFMTYTKDKAKGEQLLLELREPLSKSGCPAITSVFVDHRLYEFSKSRRPAEEKFERLDNLIRSMVRFAEEENATEDQRYVSSVIHDRLNSLHSSYQEDFRVACMLSDKVHPYQKHVFAGQKYLDLAWKSRGNGFARRVTPEGWKGFYENLEKSIAHFEQAWHLVPQAPEPATKMMAAIRGSQSRSNEQRFWFLEAVNARFDYMPAYGAYTYSISPRWGGSHRQQLDFAEECMAVNRWETPVPQYGINVVYQIHNEVGNDRFLGHYPGVADVAERFVTDAQKAMSTLSVGYFGNQTHWALAASVLNQAGKFDVAKKIFVKSDQQLPPGIFSVVGQKKSYVKGMAYAMTGPSGKEVSNVLLKLEEALETLRDGEPLGDSKAIHQLLDQLPEIDKQPESQPMFRDIAVMIEQMEQFNSGQTVNFAVKKEMPGWMVYSQDMELLDGGIVKPRGTNTFRGHYLQPMAHFKGPYEVEATVVMYKSNYKEGSNGIIIGQPRQDRIYASMKPLWLRIGYAGRRIEISNFDVQPADGWHFERYLRTRDVPESKIPKEYHLRVRVWPGRYQCFVNDELMKDSTQYRNLVPPQIAFGQVLPQRNFGAGQLKDMRIRKLTELPPEKKK